MIDLTKCRCQEANMRGELIPGTADAVRKARRSRGVSPERRAQRLRDVRTVREPQFEESRRRGAGGEGRRVMSHVTDINDRPPSASVTNEIHQFMHCRRCAQECISGAAGEVSPREYARIEIGMTSVGIQVWCVRHEINIIHVDFEGAQHPAVTTI